MSNNTPTINFNLYFQSSGRSHESSNRNRERPSVSSLFDTIFNSTQPDTAIRFQIHDPANDDEAIQRNRGISLDSLFSNTTISTITSGTGDTGSTEDVCTICHSTFTNGEVTRSINNCGHVFHIQCIEQWFRTHNTCPICRQPVQSINSANSTNTAGNTNTLRRNSTAI